MRVREGVAEAILAHARAASNKGFKIVPLAVPREETSRKLVPVEHLRGVTALNQDRSGSAAAVVTLP